MLNTNIYGRPFDDTSQQRIREEARASYKIFLLSSSGFISIHSSDILFAELSLIEDEPKRDIIMMLAEAASQKRISITDEIISLSDELFPLCKDHMDSLHIASACIGNCQYFVTCDDELLKKNVEIERYLKKKGFIISILNPITFMNLFE